MSKKKNKKNNFFSPYFFLHFNSGRRIFYRQRIYANNMFREWEKREREKRDVKILLNLHISFVAVFFFPCTAWKMAWKHLCNEIKMAFVKTGFLFSLLRCVFFLCCKCSNRHFRWRTKENIESIKLKNFNFWMWMSQF